MTFPLNDLGVASGLLSGFAFGYVLENAGFGSARKLTAQFELRDWSLFKVMFPAIVVAATGLQVLEDTNMLTADALFIPQAFLYATALGGVLVGSGFVIGGYCPGTSLVATASGRWDGLFFLLGLLAGTLLFAYGYESFRPFLESGPAPLRQTLPELLGAPAWLILGVLAVAAAAGYLAGSQIERRKGGPLSAEEVMTSVQRDRVSGMREGHPDP